MRSHTRARLALASLATAMLAATAPVASAGDGPPRLALDPLTAAPIARAIEAPRAARIAFDPAPATRDPATHPRAEIPKPDGRGRSAHAPQSPRSTRHSKPDVLFRGRNHVWIPALGVSRSIAFSACSSTAYPGPGVYRWGCAGRNNVYLFAHAYAAFKPLHDAYVRGTLRRGMRLIYADAAGRVHVYSVSWWRVTTATNGGFAYTSQARPSLTLQTCLGAKSQYRLIVRLTQTG